jgi:hypothetical protein
MSTEDKLTISQETTDNTENQRIANKIAGEERGGLEVIEPAYIDNPNLAQDMAIKFEETIKAIKENKAKTAPKGFLEKVVEAINHKKEIVALSEEQKLIREARKKFVDLETAYYSKQKWNSPKDERPGSFHTTTTEQGDDISISLDDKKRLTAVNFYPKQPISLKEVERIKTRTFESEFPQGMSSITRVSILIGEYPPKNQFPGDGSIMVFEDEQGSILRANITERSPLFPQMIIMKTLDRLGVSPYIWFAPEDVRPADWWAK